MQLCVAFAWYSLVKGERIVHIAMVTLLLALDQNFKLVFIMQEWCFLANHMGQQVHLLTAHKTSLLQLDLHYTLDTSGQGFGGDREIFLACFSLPGVCLLAGETKKLSYITRYGHTWCFGLATNITLISSTTCHKSRYHDFVRL